MPDGGFHVDVTALRQYATTIRQAARDLDTARDQFANSPAKEVGTTDALPKGEFRTWCAKQFTDMNSVLRTRASNLNTYADGLELMANNYESSDQSASDTLAGSGG